MKANLIWTETPPPPVPQLSPEKENIKNICYCLAFNPSGTKLASGIGSRIYIYDPKTSLVINALKGHKKAIYSLCYSNTGKRLVSGSADKTVIIWSDQGEGICKYSHADSIQCVLYSPVNETVISGTQNDFGLWLPNHSPLIKKQVSSRILSMSWTSDGQNFALGFMNGNVSIRDKLGEELVLVELNGSSIWCMAFRKEEELWRRDVLIIGNWDGEVIKLNLTGEILMRQQLKDIGNPCTLTYLDMNYNYFVVSGTDGIVHLLNKKGRKLKELIKKENWVWDVKMARQQGAESHENIIAVGCQDGSVSLYKMSYNIVHAYHRDIYVIREKLENIIIKDLRTNEKLYIKCDGGYIHKISIYKEMIAILLRDKIIIYNIENIKKIHKTIKMEITCKSLVLASSHILICQDKVLKSYDFEGNQERQWHFDDIIEYIKIIGGPSKYESFILSLSSGAIYQIFINNQFPYNIINHKKSVQNIDINSDVTKVAISDVLGTLAVYSMKTENKIFEEKNLNIEGLAWNEEFPDMLCYSNDEFLYIRINNDLINKMKFNGIVAGFNKSTVYSLFNYTIQAIDVSHTLSLKKYLENNDFENAYKIACLGVTQKDWEEIGIKALNALKIDIAKKAFIRIKKMTYLDIIGQMKKAQLHQNVSSQLKYYLPQILAYQGRYIDAADLYGHYGQVDEAMSIFSDLKRFQEAKNWAEKYANDTKTSNSNLIIKEMRYKEAEWSEEVHDLKAASEMYIECKQYEKAINILSKHNWMKELIQVVRDMDKTEEKLLKKCIEIFEGQEEYEYTLETLKKLNNTELLLEFYMRRKLWKEAFLLAKDDGTLNKKLNLEYARDLIFNKEYEKALEALGKSQENEKKMKLLEDLSETHIIRESFKQASNYMYKMAKQTLVINEHNYNKYMDLAEIYYAYHFVFETITNPFSIINKQTLFNICRFIVIKIEITQGSMAPKGVKLSDVLHLLAKLATELGAFTVAKAAYQKLQSLYINKKLKEIINLESLLICSKPYSDDEQLLPICYKCCSINSLSDFKNLNCIHCGCQFHYSFITFEMLPIVEIKLKNDIKPEDAIKLIGSSTTNIELQNGKLNENYLSLENSQVSSDVIDECETLIENEYDVTSLKKLKKSEIIILEPIFKNDILRLFKIVENLVPICVGPCGHFFEQDEYEMWALEHHTLPFSDEKFIEKI